MSLLQVMDAMEISVGQNAHVYVRTEDDYRIAQAELRGQETSKEGRLRRRQQNLEQTGIIDNPEDLYYGPGVDDSM